MNRRKRRFTTMLITMGTVASLYALVWCVRAADTVAALTGNIIL